MKETLQFLTQIQPPRNFMNRQSLNAVAEYIKNRLEDYGLIVEFQEFSVGGNIYKNVIGTLNPQYDKRVIVGGHYDVCGDIQGADDNASAVAGLVETARQLAIKKDKLKYRVEFVAFTLEEPPYFGTENMGSFVHAKSLKDNNIDVIGMINYEMIGYFTDEPNSQNYPIEQMKLLYPSVGNFVANICNENSVSFLKELKFNNTVTKDIDSHDIVLPDMFAGITTSDHLNYWKMGFNAVMITDTAYFRNPNYHTENDTIETINFEKMQYVVDMIVLGICSLTTKQT